MKKSERMKTVQAIADRDERAQAKALANAQLDAERHGAKLKELLAYYGEYATAIRIDQNRSVDLAHMQESRHFLSKLSQAIVTQRQVVANAEAAVRKQRKNWIDARARCKSRNALADRYRDNERREADRREQLVLDDLNNQRFVWLKNRNPQEMA